MMLMMMNCIWMRN